jgi:hypothetical protein
MGFTMAEKRKITGEFAPRYRKADKAGKTRILDEYPAPVGGNRKYAVFKPGREGKQQLRLIDGRYVNVRVSGGTRRERVYPRYYDDAVKTVLIRLRAFFRCICGERLTPLIKANLDALCRRKRFGISPEIKVKLRRISRSTVERLLREERRKRRLKGRSTTRKGTLLKNQIPVRVFWARDGKKAGFCEIDTVSHDGGGAINNLTALP